MTTDLAAGTGVGALLHEAAFYECDDEFLDLVIPFVQGGLDASQPTVVALDDNRSELVRSAIRASPDLTFVPEQYDRPATVLKSVNKLLTEYLSQGARQIRIVGEVPHPGVGVPWDWWARYEATVNHAFAEFPLWALCPYDRRITSDEVLDDVARTHPYLVTPDGRHVVNDRYTDPAVFLTQPRSPRADPLEAAPPVIDLLNPTAAAARRAVVAAAHATALRDDEVADLVIAVSEVVTNAACHGGPPARLRLWSDRDRIVVAVSDQGHGPSDPFAGLLPAAKAPSGGLGLWLAHQLVNLVTFDRYDDGFTVRLVAGNPYPAA
ncbi:MAG TPA: anti-sigma factor RsbA family regulatory protein [Pseudonocardiaceae bacterium]|nr:anti-sigma factor RsbA family regulatory protein [Pseudonocardiaceae bacterium]